MRSSPAVAAFSKDVLSYVSCFWCRTGQEHKSSFRVICCSTGEGGGKWGAQSWDCKVV